MHLEAALADALLRSQPRFTYGAVTDGRAPFPALDPEADLLSHITEQNSSGSHCRAILVHTQGRTIAAFRIMALVMLRLRRRPRRSSTATASIYGMGCGSSSTSRPSTIRRDGLQSARASTAAAIRFGSLSHTIGGKSCAKARRSPVRTGVSRPCPIRGIQMGKL
jgi:hypothetical protein